MPSSKTRIPVILVAAIGVILVVLFAARFLLGWLVADIGTSIANPTAVEGTRLRLAQVVHDIEEARRSVGRLPTTLDEIYRESPRDAWGNTILYQPHADGTYLLQSPGRDGQAGNSDDVVRNADPKADATFDVLAEWLRRGGSPAP